LVVTKDFLKRLHAAWIGTQTGSSLALGAVLRGKLYGEGGIRTLGTLLRYNALAKCGRINDAEAVLKQCEAIAGDVGLFAEEASPREKIFLGNTPLLFAQVEYARAVMQVTESRRRINRPA
jgi:hypothetical protein